MMFTSTVKTKYYGTRRSGHTSFVPSRRSRFALNRKCLADKRTATAFKAVGGPSNTEADAEAFVLDENGFPTNSTILKITSWPNNDPSGLLVFLEQAFGEGSIWKVRFVDGVHTVMCNSNGSESASLAIWALQINDFWRRNWIQTNSQGCHWFKLPPGFPCEVLAKWLAREQAEITA